MRRLFRWGAGDGGAEVGVAIADVDVERVITTRRTLLVA
jgi:hypothetical protein